jgi:hypothetical protein
LVWKHAREIEELKTDLEFKISNMNKILEDELLSLKEFEMEIADIK